MLKKENRVTTRFQFNITRRFGAHYTARFFHLYVLEPRNYIGESQIGIVVSNKLAKSAVSRNKVKRRFRESIRNNFDKINPNLWLVFHPKHQSLVATYEELNTDINQTLQKISFTR